MLARPMLPLLLVLACAPTPVTTDGGTGDAGTTAAATGDASTGAASTGDASTGAASTGTTASPTTGGPAGPGFCTPTCKNEGQPCRVDGYAGQFLCVDGVCELSACASDEVCHLSAAKWGSDCFDQSECPDPGHACIDYAGGGRCAPLELEAGDCAASGLVPRLVALVMSDEDVTVCADEAARCVDGNCFFPCRSDADCPAEQGRPRCDVDSGECRCDDDADCLASGAPGLVACAAGKCGCNVDADCAGGTNIDVCIDGTCGCSSTAVCTEQVFDGVVQVCRPG